MDHPISILLVGLVMFFGLSWSISWRVEKDTTACAKRGGVYLPNEGACVRGIELLMTK